MASTSPKKTLRTINYDPEKIRDVETRKTLKQLVDELERLFAGIRNNLSVFNQTGLTAVVSNSPLTGDGTDASHLSIPKASGSVDGYLDNVDWTTFNNKLSAEADTLATVTGRGATTSQQITSTLADGTKPFAVASGTKCDNLNADKWDDHHLPTLDSGKYLKNNGSALSWDTPTITDSKGVSKKEGVIAGLYEGQDSPVPVGNVGGVVYRRCQTFTVGSVGENVNNVLKFVKLQGYWATRDPGIFTVDLYAVDGSNKPTGSVLSTGTVDVNTVLDETHYSWFKVEMSPYTLVAGIKYTLVFSVSVTATSGDIVNLGANETSGYNFYLGGERGYSTDGGSTWTMETDYYKIMFEQFGQAV